MYTKNVAVVGGGFAGICLMAGMIRAAVDTQQTNLAITLFEPDTIGPGIAYDLEAPDAFKLNHELDFMGSVNVHLAHTDGKDFYNWVQRNRDELASRYSDYDLTNPKEYVPRNLFGRYLRAQNEATSQFEAWYAHDANEAPLPLGKAPEELGSQRKVHPTTADVCVDAMGLGRSISHLPLYHNLIESGLASSNSIGGIHVDISSRYVIDDANKPVEGLYAIGHMTCGETVLPHNSLHLSRVGIAIGANIVDFLGASPAREPATAVQQLVS